MTKSPDEDLSATPGTRPDRRNSVAEGACREDDEAHARLAAIVDSSEDAIISKSLEGIITSWNKSAERIFGYSAEEAVGRPIRIIAAAGRPPEMEEILKRIRR